MASAAGAARRAAGRPAGGGGLGGLGRAEPTQGELHGGHGGSVSCKDRGYTIVTHMCFLLFFDKFRFECFGMVSGKSDRCCWFWIAWDEFHVEKCGEIDGKTDV